MPQESKTDKQKRALQILELMHETYPGATTALNWRTPLELLIATVLSAQCTDEKVNQVTAELFNKYETCADWAAVDQEVLEQEIRPTGFFRNKAKSIRGACAAICERFGGEVPQTMEEMLTLPGVARKTANVVLGTAFGVAEGIVVDTHVSRLALRMGLAPQQKTKSINTDKIEQALMELFPRDQWVFIAHALIWHGRRICPARKPMCDECRVNELCPKVGVQVVQVD